jgi:hypothetical protein
METTRKASLKIKETIKAKAPQLDKNRTVPFDSPIHFQEEVL